MKIFLVISERLRILKTEWDSNESDIPKYGIHIGIGQHFKKAPLEKELFNIL